MNSESLGRPSPARLPSHPLHKMSATLPSLLASLAVLLLGRMDRLADACSCSPVHPQQAFCNADVGKENTADRPSPSLRLP